jgi:uncharacterized protein (TIRG00374 family)
VFIFASKISDRVSFWDCFRANLANTCIGAITPSQTGGWAGQLYILYRSNITLVGGATITVITFLSTLIFFLFSALFVIVFNSQLLKGKMVLLMEYCFVMFGIVLAIFILLLLKLRFIFNILSRFSSSRLFKFNHRIHKFFQKLMIKLEHLINDYKDYTELFIKQGKVTLLHGVFITFDEIHHASRNCHFIHSNLEVFYHLFGVTCRRNYHRYSTKKRYFFGTWNFKLTDSILPRGKIYGKYIR